MKLGRWEPEAEETRTGACDPVLGDGPRRRFLWLMVESFRAHRAGRCGSETWTSTRTASGRLAGPRCRTTTLHYAHAAQAAPAGKNPLWR